MTPADLPAWSEAFSAGVLREVPLSGPLSAVTPEWAWGGSTGRGVRVGVVDGGIEHDHPALGGCVRGGVVVEYDEAAEDNIRIEPDEPPRDVAGHGTACAGIIHALAPEAELYSVRVLGGDMMGRALQFANGLDWAIQHGMQVVNLSLSTARRDYYALFHELADEAYFANVVLVSAVNNVLTALSLALFLGDLGGGARRARPADLLLQPRAAGRVWRGGHRRARGLERGAHVDVHRQQLCRAAHRGAGGANPRQAPRADAVPDQDGAAGLRQQLPPARLTAAPLRRRAPGGIS